MRVFATAPLTYTQAMPLPEADFLHQRLHCLQTQARGTVALQTGTPQNRSLVTVPSVELQKTPLAFRPSLHSRRPLHARLNLSGSCHDITLSPPRCLAYLKHQVHGLKSRKTCQPASLYPTPLVRPILFRSTCKMELPHHSFQSP